MIRDQRMERPVQRRYLTYDLLYVYVETIKLGKWDHVPRFSGLGIRQLEGHSWHSYTRRSGHTCRRIRWGHHMSNTEIQFEIPARQFRRRAGLDKYSILGRYGTG